MVKHIRFKIYFILLLVGLLAQAACGTDASQVRGVSTDISMTYQREGGIAGITQEWIIFPDGRIVGPGGQEMQVPPEEVITLLAKSAEIESSSLQESYVPDDNCCDQFIYTIIIKVGDQETRVRTSDGADHPEMVTSLLDDIKSLLSTAEPAE